MQGSEISGSDSFGSWVQKRRRAMSLTRDQLAEKVGCAAVTIKKIERDERKPSRQVAELLADQLLIPRAARERFLHLARESYSVPEAWLAGSLRFPPFLQPDQPSGFASQAPFVGRKAELAQLETWFDQALSGRAAPAFLLGDAGRGKTSLMREFARVAQKTHPDLLVSGGQCNAQTGPGDPFRPFRDILGILTGDLEIDWTIGMLNREQAVQIWSAIPDVVAAITASGPHLLGSLLPVDPLVKRLSPYLGEKSDWFERLQKAAEAEGTNPASGQQVQVLEELTQVLRAIGSKHPLLLLLDDLQWVDDASLNVLYHLGRRLRGSRVFLLASYRTPERISSGPQKAADEGQANTPEDLIREMRRQYGENQLRLDQVSEAEGRAFIDALVDLEPNRLDEAFRQDLYLRTRGHALFATELIHNMRQNQNLMLDAEGRWVLNTSLPPAPPPARVEAVIEQRLAALSPVQRELLNVASVEGEAFIAEVVANVLGLEVPRAVEMLSRDLGQQRRLVQEQGQLRVRDTSVSRYQFHHMLIQEYIYDRLVPGEKRRLHRRLLEELEKVLADPAEGSRSVRSEYLDAFGARLMRHALLGEEWTKAATYGRELGRLASQRYALRESMAYYERALFALDQLSSAPEPLTVDMLLGWVEAAFKFTPYDLQLERLARAEQIARKLNDKPRLIQILHWKANVLLARGRWSQAGPTLAESLGLAREVGEERLSVRPLYFQALMTSFGDPDQSLRLFALAKELSRKHGDLQVEALAFATEGQVRAGLGDFEGARQALDDAHAASHRLGSPVLESDVDHFAAWAWLAMGDMTRAMEFGQRSLETAVATDNMDCTCGSMVCIGYVNLELGKFAEATSAFEEGVARSEAAGALLHKQEGQAGLAAVRFFEGHQDAISNLESVIKDMRGLGNLVGAATTSQMLGACLMQIGEHERAMDCLRQAVEFERRAGMSPALIRALRTLADLMDKQGNPSQAQRYREEAATLDTGLGSPQS